MLESPRRLLLATTNPHKIVELRQLLKGIPYALVTPVDLGLALEVEETGHTFTENASQKALAYATSSGEIALADDSGLEVDALGGEPGIRSARWLGVETPYPVRFRVLLERLRDVPPPRRTARYRAVLALGAPSGLLTAVEGTLEGRIADEPRGTSGFGYDPIFYVPTLKRTLGEVTPQVKGTVSHRARAAALAREILLIWARDGVPLPS